MSKSAGDKDDNQTGTRRNLSSRVKGAIVVAGTYGVASWTTSNTEPTSDTGSVSESEYKFITNLRMNLVQKMLT